MITVVEKGSYRLTSTKNREKVLNIGGKLYGWYDTASLGQIERTAHITQPGDHTLASGFYRLYSVQDEPHMANQYHLELNVGERLWQGYLLPNGLPRDQKQRNEIIPTNVVLSHRRSITTVR